MTLWTLSSDIHNRLQLQAPDNTRRGTWDAISGISLADISAQTRIASGHASSPVTPLVGMKSLLEWNP
jgi:hypothetical protein